MTKASHYSFLILLFLPQLPSGSEEEEAALRKNNFNIPLSCFHCCITCAHLPCYTLAHTAFFFINGVEHVCLATTPRSSKSREAPAQLKIILWHFRWYDPNSSLCLTVVACVFNLYIPDWAGPSEAGRREYRADQRLGSCVCKQGGGF